MIRVWISLCLYFLSFIEVLICQLMVFINIDIIISLYYLLHFTFFKHFFLFLSPLLLLPIFQYCYTYVGIFSGISLRLLIFFMSFSCLEYTVCMDSLSKKIALKLKYAAEPLQWTFHLNCSFHKQNSFCF